MIEDTKAIKRYFDEHPEARAIVEHGQFQFECWRPEFEGHPEKYIRPLTVDDIHFITVGGWFGERGIFAWFYPGGVPHYVQIGEIPPREKLQWEV